MDVLTVHGKSYVKASVLARELGYTSDYIGQLCRADKVEAKLVGRSWYVEKSSIASHKSTRYRSTQAKTVKAVHSELQELRNEHILPAALRSNFYTHSTLKPVSVYEQDGSDLLPPLRTVEQKTGVLPVGLGDATTVKIVSERGAYQFHTPEQVAPQFSGSLSISEYDDAQALVPDGGVLLHPKEVEQLKVHKKFSEEDEFEAIPEVEEKKVHTTIKKGAKTTHVPVDLVAEEVVVAAQVLELQSSSKSYNLSILFSGVAAFTLVILFLSLEAHLIFTKDLLTTSYILKFENLTATAHLAVNYLQ